MIYKSRDIRWAKIRLMLCSSGWKRAKYLKKKQIFYAMGEGLTILHDMRNKLYDK